ncbi:MAG TPA: hypothetical protein VMR70_20935 [Flavisolibacter sp.]|nr:hypothetical protein [Flavisolibacter sp.]
MKTGNIERVRKKKRQPNPGTIDMAPFWMIVTLSVALIIWLVAQAFK